VLKLIQESRRYVEAIEAQLHLLLTLARGGGE